MISMDPIDSIAPALDERFTYRGYFQHGAVCRIRIYRPAGKPPVIVCTELPENTNTSITNMAEHLAAEVIRRYLPARFEHPDGVVWIEHYPPDRGSNHARS